MREIATSFYMDLLFADPSTKMVIKCKNEVWKSTQVRVTKHMQNRLTIPLMVMETKTALEALPKQSCPSEDSLTPLFYLKYWEILGHTLSDASQQIGITCIMPHEMSKGLVFLILRVKGYQLTLRNGV
jgi:hypothetical protein